jgi:hypothetical protein
MTINPISGLGGVTVPSAASYSTLTQASPTRAALLLNEAKQSETIEQRANDGDTAALTQLAEAEKQLIPIDSQQLLPPQIQPPPLSQQPAKGILIDVYD